VGRSRTGSRYSRGLLGEPWDCVPHSRKGWKVGIGGKSEWVESQNARMVEQSESCNGWKDQIVGWLDSWKFGKLESWKGWNGQIG